MLSKLVFLAAVLPVLTFSQPAEARRLFWWEANPDPYNDQAPPPDYYADQPDPYVSDQEQFNRDQYLQYRRELDRRYHRPTYYYPDQAQPNGDARPAYGADRPYAAPVYPVTPAKKPVRKLVKAKPTPKPSIVGSAPTTPARPALATAAPTAGRAPPVMPNGPMMAKPDEATAAAVPPQAPVTTASTTAAAPAPVKAPKSGVLSCDKGAGVVSSFGFSNVTSKSCTGTTLIYGAERSGKPFEIEVNAKSGELTAVKKL